MPQTCGWKEQNYGNLIYALNFSLDQIGELFLNSAPRIDLIQSRRRFFQAASSALLQIQTTQSNRLEKKGLLK